MRVELVQPGCERTMQSDIEVSRSVAVASSTSHSAKDVGVGKGEIQGTIHGSLSTERRPASPGIPSPAGTIVVRSGVKSISLKLSEADAPVSETSAR